MYKIIVAGSRLMHDYFLVESVLSRIIQNYPKQEIEIVSGGAKGADKLGELFATKHQLNLKVFPADWDNLGKKAGPIRNQQMADYATHCIVFWDGISRGSKDMIERAQKKGLSTIVYNYLEKNLKIL